MGRPIDCSRAAWPTSCDDVPPGPFGRESSAALRLRFRPRGDEVGVSLPITSGQAVNLNKGRCHERASEVETLWIF